MTPRILLVDADGAHRKRCARHFRVEEGFEVVEAATLAAADAEIAVRRFDAVVLDLDLPDGSGLDLIAQVKVADAELPVVVATASPDVPLVVEAMRRGAENYLVKPIDFAALGAELRRTVADSRGKRKQFAVRRLQRKDDIFFGAGSVMQANLDMASLAATNDSPVLIVGETGTGKGVLAKWIHRNSPRSMHEFVEVNCSALRGDMLARELFGAVRGAYTSADQDRQGLLDVADRGTLFLDEIGDMSPDVQAQFLKLLEEKTYRRLGDVKLRRSDFRLVAATNRDIRASVADGTFRQDLLYRINLIVIDLPPLRDRKEDLPALANHLLRDLGSTVATVPDEVVSLLAGCTWPGNIRELRNVLQRALLVSRGAPLAPCHFGDLTDGNGPAPGRQSVRDVELAHILAVLRSSGNNVVMAAERLGISRATLYRRLRLVKADGAFSGASFGKLDGR